jgi:hypothetical protein
MAILGDSQESVGSSFPELAFTGVIIGVVIPVKKSGRGSYQK